MKTDGNEHGVSGGVCYEVAGRHVINYFRGETDKTKLRFRVFLTTIIGGACASILVGCGGTQTTATSSGTGTTTTTTGPNATGNWQINLAATTSKLPISTLTGFIQENAETTASQFTTADFLETPTTQTSCFETATAPMPFSGDTNGTALEMTSLAFNNQYLTLSGTLGTATPITMTGTYLFTSGCANADAGTFTGALYTALTGTYTGTTPTTPIGINLTVTQAPTGNDHGVLELSGNATFSGSSCFSTGTIDATRSYVTGQNAVVTLVTNDLNSADVVLTGTINVSATQISLTSVAITAGNCATTLAATTLSKS
jgi:hypothetical protein